jgi:hypothetical protein
MALRRSRWGLLVLGGFAGLALYMGAAAEANAFVTTTVTTHPMSEPGVVVAPDGTVYVDGPEGILSTVPNSPSPVFRSEDGGATWRETPFGTRSDFPGGGDSDIAIDPVSGALYMTDLWLGDSTVSVSSDKGETWQSNPLQGAPIQDRQWVATSGNGIVYHAVHQIPLGLVVSRGSGGLAYPQSTVAATPVDQTGCICPPGNLIAEADPAGEEPIEGLGSANEMVGLIYATSSGGINFARSEDSGLTFTNVEIQGESPNATDASFPVVANAGGDHLVATWLNIQGEGSSVAYSDSSDWGETWSQPRTLVSSGTSVYPWIAARGAKVAISLYHTSAAGAPETVPESAEWFETYLESTDGGATFTEPVDVEPGLTVKLGPICLEGVECSEDRELGDFQSLAIDNEGDADLAWMHASGEESTEVLLTRQGEQASLPTPPEGTAPTGTGTGATLSGHDRGPRASGGGIPAAGSSPQARQRINCLARARRAAAKRLAAAKHRHGQAKRRSTRAAHRRERKAIARCRSHMHRHRRA